MAKPQLPPGCSVRYRHERMSRYLASWEQPERKSRTIILPHGGTTTAFIIDSENKNILAEGYSHCHPRDNFCKRIGRDIALGRALKDLAADD